MSDASGDTNMSSLDPSIDAEGGTLSTAGESGAGDDNVETIVQTAEDKLLTDLGPSLQLHAQSGTFACGGSVPFTTSTAVTQADTPLDNPNEVEAPTISPVRIRFGDSGKGITLTLPSADNPSKEFESLLSVCQPASFGRGDKDVFDDDYRKARKLDRDDFDTNFCPYQAGIIDIVAQLLLPQTTQDRHMRSIRAELYKLNVYSAPSGKFKAHVDTPRSKSQVGSLVVALPVEHKGGSLAVRHLGKEILFDWSTLKEDLEQEATDNLKLAIKWAAFYSDCEHEVHEVTAGHRVTLTYNLYACRGQGHLAGSAPSLDATQLPLYKHLSNALADPGFLRRGQILGVWLNHSYAHTSEHLNFLPHSLKGADMSLYETARVLDLECELAPVKSYDDVEGGVPLFHRTFHGFEVDDSDPQDDDEDRISGWGRVLADRKIMWLNQEPGSRVHPRGIHRLTEGQRAEEQEQNATDPKEVQMAYMAYGNQSEMAFHYSRVVMFIRVPKFQEVGEPTEQLRPLLSTIESRSNDSEDDDND